MTALKTAFTALQPILSLVLLTIWSIVFLRLLGGRATLSIRTFATLGVTGALLGSLSASLVTRLLAPYGDAWISQRLLLAVAWQAVLLAPVALCLWRPGVREVTSVADAFLAGFAVGLGYDLATLAIVVSYSLLPFEGFAYLPPWQFQAPDGPVIAGFGYWTALVALAATAARRFFRRKAYRFLITGLVLFWVSVECMASVWPIPADSPLATFTWLTGSGEYTAFIALAALVALSIYEGLWVANAGVTPSSKPLALEETQELITLLARGRLHEYLDRERHFGLRRQSEIAQASRRDDHDGTRLERLGAHLTQQAALTINGTPAPARDRPVWKNANLWTWVALVFVLFLLPLLPLGVTTFFWTTSLLHFRIGTLPTLLNIVLVVVIVRRFLVSAGRPEPVPNDIVRFRSEQAIAVTAIGLVLLVLLYATPNQLYPPPGWRPIHGPGLSNDQAPQITTLFLLFATAAIGLTTARGRAWRIAPIEARRVTALQQVLTLLTMFVVAWLALEVYIPAIQAFHGAFGDRVFEWAVWIHPEDTATTGNSTVAAAVIVFTALLTAVLVRVLRTWSARFQTFLLGR